MHQYLMVFAGETRVSLSNGLDETEMGGWVCGGELDRGELDAVLESIHASRKITYI